MDTKDFFQLLYSLYPTDADLTIEIRPLLPEWQKESMTEEGVREVHSSVRRWYTIAPEYLSKAAKYAEGYRDAFDVYFGVLPRVGRQGGQSGVWGASCLFCDVDGGQEGVEGAKQRIVACGLPLPQLAVKSGGGIHCYWILREIVTFETHPQRETYKSILRRLCAVIGGASPAAHADFSACECARILRVPNTTNWKRQDAPRDTKIVRCSLLYRENTELLSYEEWGATLPPEPIKDWKEKRAPVASYSSAGFISDGLLRWARTGYPEGKRHQDLTGAAAWLVRDCGLPKDAALELLWQKAQVSGGRRTIRREEVEAMIRWA
jgi:hypothetical protein